MALLRLALVAALAFSSAGCTRDRSSADQDESEPSPSCELVVVRIEVVDLPFESDFEVFLPLRGPSSALLPVNGVQVLPIVGSVTGFQSFAAQDGVFEALVPVPPSFGRDMTASVEGELRDGDLVASFAALPSCVR